MTRIWEPVEVEPLIESEEQRRFWETWQPKVGDRVRVRLSGECQVLGTWKVGHLGEALGIKGGLRNGHPDHVDGLDGYVLATSGASYPGHPYWVRLRCADAPTGYHRGYFAACELERIQ